MVLFCFLSFFVDGTWIPAEDASTSVVDCCQMVAEYYDGLTLPDGSQDWDSMYASLCTAFKLDASAWCQWRRT